MSCKTCILKQLLASAVCNNAGPDANIVDLQSRLHIINPCIFFTVLSCHVSNTLERHGLLENSTLALWLFFTCGVFVAYPCPHSHVPNVGYPEQVQHLLHGVSAAKQKTEAPRPCLQDAYC